MKEQLELYLGVKALGSVPRSGVEGAGEESKRMYSELGLLGSAYIICSFDCEEVQTVIVGLGKLLHLPCCFQ